MSATSKQSVSIHILLALLGMMFFSLPAWAGPEEVRARIQANRDRIQQRQQANRERIKANQRRIRQQVAARQQEIRQRQADVRQRIQTRREQNRSIIKSRQQENRERLSAWRDEHAARVEANEERFFKNARKLQELQKTAVHRKKYVPNIHVHRHGSSGHHVYRRGLHRRDRNIFIKPRTVIVNPGLHRHRYRRYKEFCRDDGFSFSLKLGSVRLGAGRRSYVIKRQPSCWFHRPRYRSRNVVCYYHGPYVRFSYVHPVRFKKYVFVSFGGYWPERHTYLRYSCYPCHPFRWYGYGLPGYSLTGDTYNYYVYNNGQRDPHELISASSPDIDIPAPPEVSGEITATESIQETDADKCFNDGVKLFEDGQYEASAAKFKKAILLQPEDLVLPFACVQALFAAEHYVESTAQLRGALLSLPEDRNEAFFPRGLYQQEETLLGQVDKLRFKADTYTYHDDLQLLAGYQLIGTGQLETAAQTLTRISENSKNAQAAERLLGLLKEISKRDEAQTDD